MNNIVYIYVLLHPITKEVRYVGKANNLKRRMQSHVDYAKIATKKRPVVDWIMSLLKEGIRPEMKAVEESNKTNWPKREMFWIASFKEQGARLLNLTDGGESNNGYVYSEELKNIRREAKTGKPIPQTVRELIASTLSREIVCIESGIIYPSMKSAIKETGVPRSTFHRRFHKSELINNKTYRYNQQK